MRFLIGIFVFVTMLNTGLAQNGIESNLANFSEEILELALANSEVTFMTEEEKQVVFFMNLVRLEPQIFLNEVVRPYIKENYAPGNYYCKTLISDLKKAKPTSVILMKEDLYRMAIRHRKDIGKKGISSHSGSRNNTFTERSRPLLSTYYGTGENIGFGYQSAFENVMELLIDDKIKSFGHRCAILNPEYNCCGVSIGFHKKYETCCVIDFGILTVND
jgi:hypothetical protein